MSILIERLKRASLSNNLNSTAAIQSHFILISHYSGYDDQQRLLVGEPVVLVQEPMRELNFAALDRDEAILDLITKRCSRVNC